MSVELGWHGVTVSSVDMVEVGKDDNVQTAIQIEVTFEEGETMSFWGYFSEGAIDWTGDVLEACGWTPDSPENNWDVTKIDMGKESPLVGNKVRAHVIEEEYQGKYRKKIKNLSQGGTKRKAKTESRKALIDRIKGHKRDPQRFDKMSSKPAHTPAQVTEEETPF